MFNQVNSRRPLGRLAAGAALGFIGAVASIGVMAQPPAGGRPGGFGQPGGGRRGGGGQPGGRMFGGRNMTAATTSVSALTAELNLTAKQQQQIKDIQAKFRKDMRAMMPAGGPGGPGGPRPGGPGGPNGPRPGGPGGPGGPRPGGAPFDVQKMQDMASKASTSIEAVLTPAQRKQLPGAVKEIGAIGQAGIPIETLGELKLTSAQKAKISTIGDKSQKDMVSQFRSANGDFQKLRPVIQQLRDKAHTDVLAVLTSSQKSVIDKYEKEHPRRGFGGGGPGGFGGPGGGRRGGPGGPGGRPAGAGSPKI